MSQDINAVGDAATFDVPNVVNGVLNVFHYGTFASFTGVWEATVDGTNWYSVPAYSISSRGWNTSIVGVSNLTAAYLLPFLGAIQIRNRCTVWNSGPVTFDAGIAVITNTVF